MLGLCYHKGSGGRELGGYDQDQVALVVPDYTVFGSRAGYSGYTNH